MTPFLLVGMHHSMQARFLLTLEWIGALGGSVFAACSDLNNPTTNNIELTIFISMGFAIVPLFVTATSTIPGTAMLLITLGAAAYLIGIAFYILGERKPIYHVIWHLFVALAAALHWFATYWYVVPLELKTTIPIIMPPIEA